MIRVALVMGLALAVVAPVTATAQDTPSSPEGIEWHLVSYADDAQASVPWFVDATLLLEDGTAAGSTSCNEIGGTYAIDGPSLSFDELLVTQRACADDESAAVEAGYVAALPQVAAWAIEEDQLRLTDAEGLLLLTLEEAVGGLTRSDLASLAGVQADQAADIARLTERLDSVRIGTLRDRINALEDQLDTLRQQVRALGSSGPGTGGSSATRLTAAETVLRKAVPPRFRSTCTALRDDLPAGTVAALDCDTAGNVVAEAAYYLMEYPDAVATLRTVANATDVPNRRPRCDRRAGWWDNALPVGAEGCWVEDGVANVRIIAPAASCRQLQAGRTRLAEPVVYLALEGHDARMERLRAAGLAYTDADVYILNFDIGRSIPSAGLPLTRGCQELRGGA
jgi:heat shock protein HslJ